MPGTPRVQDNQIARQLLRFSRTDIPHTSLISSEDLYLATLLAPDPSIRASSLEVDYPLDWVESRPRFTTALRRWRTLHQIYQAADYFGLVPPTDEPSSSAQAQQAPPSVHSETRHDLSLWPDTSLLGTQPRSVSTTTLNLILSRLTLHSTAHGSGNSAQDTPALDPPVTTETMASNGGAASSADQATNFLSPEAAAQILRDATAAQDQHLGQLFAAFTEQQRQTGTAKNALKPQDIGYFDPSAEDPTNAGIIADGRTNKYTDVFAFTDRLNHMVAHNGEAEVRQVWTQCLMGPALIWHSRVLTATDRGLLETAPMRLICDKLIERFKPSWSTAMDRIQSARYTLEDLFRGKDILEYVQCVIRDAQGCDQSGPNQLKAAFKGFDCHIQSQLKIPTPATTVDEFMAEIREREPVLEKMAKNHMAGKSAKPGLKSFQFNSTGQRTDFPRDRPFRQGYGNYRQFNRPYAYQGQQGQSFRSPEQANQAPRNGTMTGQPRFTNNPFTPTGPDRRRFQQYRQDYRPDFRQDYKAPDKPKDKAYHANDQNTDNWPEDQDPCLQMDEEADDHPDQDDTGMMDTAEDCNFGTAFHESFQAPTHKCRDCDERFPSKNKLHKHLEIQHGKVRRLRDSTRTIDTDKPTISQQLDVLLNDTVRPEPSPPIEPMIITSTADTSGIGTGYGFRTYSYLKFNITPDPKHMDVESDVCGDTGCSKSLVDRQWLQKFHPHLIIRHRATPLTLRGIGTNVHSTSEYVIMPLYFQGHTQDNKPATAHFTREIAIVDDLRANMLIATDILHPEQFDILMSQDKAIIRSCEVEIPLSVIPRAQIQRTPVRSTSTVTIPPRSYTRIPVHHSADTDGQDLLFDPVESPLSVFTLLTDSNLEQILVRNEHDFPVELHKDHTVGHLMTLDPDCVAYQVSEDRAPTAAEFALRRPTAPERDDPKRPSTMLKNHAANTVRHDVTGVNVYKDPNNPTAHHKLFQVLSDFESVFRDTGFADVPEEQWMRMELMPGWEKNIARHCRQYPLNAKGKNIIETTLNGLIEKKKVYRTRRQVPFSFPVFVIWKAVQAKIEKVLTKEQADEPEMKGRMVVDIRPFNRIALNDAYPIRTQDDILDHMAGSKYQTVLDAIAFYYQWRVHPDCQWMFTINTHKGQFTFNCAVMGYKGSNAYVQRQMDWMLQDTVARCYCDDIVIPSQTLDAHVHDLRQVLSVFQERNISIGPSKSYVGYPSAIILGRLVDSFGMTTTAERMEAIKRLRFPETLRDLEVFIGFTTWLRTACPLYGILVKPLQDRKTELLKQARSNRTMSKTARKSWTTTVAFTFPSTKEKTAFEAIKASLLSNLTLAFCSPVRPLFADFDASADGIGVEVYHVKEPYLSKITNTDGVITAYPPRAGIETIAFLSRPLTDAETRYWPTEMELCGFVWLLRKCRHWIDATKAGPPIIFTDCKALLGIHGRTSDIANTTAMSATNKRIMRALEYMSQFDVRILHKPGKQHIVPDALSRLPRDPSINDFPRSKPGGLDELPDDREEHWAMHWIHQLHLPPMKLAPPPTEVDTNLPIGNPSSTSITMVHIDPDFKSRLTNGYAEDPFFRNTLEILAREAQRPTADRVRLPFELREGLLWHLSGDNERLCIPRNCVPELWDILHGPNHISYGKLVEVAQAYYVHRGLKRLREFVRACPDCQVLQPRKHKPYGSLQPILSPPCPYYNITMDFIMALPPSKQHQYEIILVIVCKLTKQISLIPGHKNWGAEDWAQRLLTTLLTSNWGLPRIIISDRDSKFLSALWTAMWKRLNTRLLYTTAYHPQTDGQSEITVQTIQSILRYHVHSLLDPSDWESTIPRLQFEYNNTRHGTTERTPNELVMGFTPAGVKDVLTLHNKQDESLRLLLLPASRIEAADAISLASMTMKKYYDRRHQPKFFNVGDRVLLRLHKGYNLPSTAATGNKMAQRYAGPFRVTERIGPLAYRLDLSQYNARIHDVITIDHLEPAIFDKYGRQLPPVGPIRTANHPRERIIAHRTTRNNVKQYLVKYEGLGHEYDEWLTEGQLEDNTNLIHDYDNRREH